MEQNINQKLEYISTWLKVNKLSLNIAKAQYMFLISKTTLYTVRDKTK